MLPGALQHFPQHQPNLAPLALARNEQSAFSAGLCEEAGYVVGQKALHRLSVNRDEDISRLMLEALGIGGRPCFAPVCSAALKGLGKRARQRQSSPPPSKDAP